MLFRCAHVRCFETLRCILTAGLYGLLFPTAIGIIIGNKKKSGSPFSPIAGSCVANKPVGGKDRRPEWALIKTRERCSPCEHAKDTDGPSEWRKSLNRQRTQTAASASGVEV
ncbi:hypothetical protein EAG_06128 [Camponotus floridanus]|uniref:Uncharacterized protein n=1 Tax=Camponotus floridanus TaxID=104421 RepID=E2A1E2_CAMFO|nr:hypothetical protein EAG_06128 [Camponotus floridanus]